MECALRGTRAHATMAKSASTRQGGAAIDTPTEAAPPTRRGRLVVWLDLLHPAPILAALATAAVVTTLAAQGRPPVGRLLPFLLAILLTQVAISLHNDYCDRELDALAKPWRALPSGLLDARAALMAALALAALGLIVAAMLGPAVFLLGALGTGAGFAYNGWLKRRRLTWLPFYVAIPALPICCFVVAGALPPRL